jgi:hypothetical protein
LSHFVFLSAGIWAQNEPVSGVALGTEALFNMTFVLRLDKQAHAQVTPLSFERE